MLGKIFKLMKFLLGPFVNFYRSNSFKYSVVYSNFLKHVKVNKNVILYESYHGKNATCNPYAIFKELQNKKEYKHFKHVWALNDLNDESAKLLKKYKNVKLVSRFSVKYVYYLTKAKYLINNTSFPVYFQKRDEQVYINTWHGVPFKQIGADSIESGVADHANIQKNMLHVDYLVSPNKFTHEKILKSNRVYDIFNGKIIDAGYPRIDLTKNADPIKIKNQLGINKDKKVILYAPTWREWDKGNEKSAVERTYNLFQSIKAQYSDEYEVILKAHYFVYMFFKEEGLDQYCVPDWMDTNELLSCVDILITDFSSIFFDFLHTKRPVIFFMYDLEEYKQRRGLYLDINDLPGPVCLNVEEVGNAINSIEENKLKYNEKYQKMLETYCYNDDGNATSRVVDVIFNGKEDYSYKVVTNKKKILFWGGGFNTNGITISFLNLLNNIDYDKYHVSIIFASKLNPSTIANLSKVNPNATVIFRKGSLNYLIKEYYFHKIVYNFGLHKKWVRKIVPKNLYRKELRRIIGNSQFDIAIDFDGYTSLWSLIFAFNKFKKKLIYMHSDMVADSQKIVNGKEVHKKTFNVIFNIYRYFDKIIGVSKDTTEINREKLSEYGISDKIININNSIDYKRILDNLDNFETRNMYGKDFLLVDRVEDFGSLSINGVIEPKSQNINFVSLGRLSPEKDFEKLIKAFAKINKKYENTKLYIIGDGVLRVSLRNLVKSLDLVDKVYFAGHMDSPFVLIKKCDCFILSSNYEGQGLAIIEALILDKPVIATDIPGPRGILEDGYGKLVENSEEGLIEGMEDYIENRPVYKKFDYVKYNQNAIETFYKEINN